MTNPIESTTESKNETKIVMADTVPPGKKRDPLIGTEIAGRYELDSLLGRGATTSVYKARDKERDRNVAVKILRTDSIFNEQLIHRFEQECKTLGLLKHINIVEQYDSGVNESDQPYLVMEYVDGTSLKDLIETDKNLDFKRVLKIFIQICAALSAAHDKGIVHRDMKPANIMLTKDTNGNELVKILDFGVAKILVQGETFQTKTQTGEMLGTLLYMSPEQCLEQVLDERCDVYSVGCVLYETLTGTPPLIGRTAFETMNKHLTEMPSKLSKVRPDREFDPRLDMVLAVSMAKDPKDRYQSISQFQSALSAILDDIDVYRAYEPPAETVDEEVEESEPQAPPNSTPPENTSVVAAEEENSLPDVYRKAGLVLALAALGALSFFVFPAFGVGCFIAMLFVLCSGSADNESEASTSKKSTRAPVQEGDKGDDTSRSGTIYFLAMEAIDGVAWRNIYADQIAQYNIREFEVIRQKTKLVAAQHDAWTEVKQYVMRSFDNLDTDKDGFISMEELSAARSVANPRLREHALLTFLMKNMEDIQKIVANGENPEKGVRRRDLSEYFLQLENMEKEFHHLPKS